MNKPRRLTRTMLIVESVDYERGVLGVFIPGVGCHVELDDTYFLSTIFKGIPGDVKPDDILYAWTNIPQENETLHIVVVERGARGRINT